MRKPITKKKPAERTPTESPLPSEAGIALPPPSDIHEEAVGTEALRQDIPEEFRQAYPNALQPSPPPTTNWSQAEDRGEDLVEEKDPFVQQDERSTQIPPELIQERAYRLYEQRRAKPGHDVED